MKFDALLPLLCLFAIVGGCERKKPVSVRETARQDKHVFHLDGSHEGHSSTRPGIKKTVLEYTLPTGWVDDPASADMRLATIKIGQSTTLVVTEMNASTYFDVLGNVNRWREQAFLPPVTDLKDQPANEVDIAGGKGILYDMPNPPSTRMMVAVLVRGDTAVFFKLSGPPDEAGAAGDDFKSFLKSITFK